MESQNSKHLTRKQFTQILRLPLKGQFETPTTDQILDMFNEMGNQTPITLVSSFKKENLPSIWNFFFRIKLRCLTGQSTGMEKSKHQFYSVVAGLYYNMQVDYALLLWAEFLLQFLTLRWRLRSKILSFGFLFSKKSIFNHVFLLLQMLRLHNFLIFSFLYLQTMIHLYCLWLAKFLMSCST